MRAGTSSCSPHPYPNPNQANPYPNPNQAHPNPNPNQAHPNPNPNPRHFKLQFEAPWWASVPEPVMRRCLPDRDLFASEHAAFDGPDGDRRQELGLGLGSGSGLGVSIW